MNKIVLVYQKKDDRMENLIKCLKHLFPECSMELKAKDEIPLSTEKIDNLSGVCVK